MLSFLLFCCLLLHPLTATRWSIHGRSFPSRRFHLSLFDCQERCMRTGLSSLTPRSPLCRIYSLSVTVFTCELGGTAAPANHGCSAARAEALCLGCTHVVLLISSHNLNYSPFFFWTPSSLLTSVWVPSVQGSTVYEDSFAKATYKGAVSLVKRHEPSTVALRAAMKAYTRSFSSSSSWLIEAVLAFRFSFARLLNTECNKSVKYWFVSSHWLVWNLQNTVKKY